MEEDSLYALFVCHMGVFQTIVTLVMLLVPLKSPWWAGVHQVGFIMFWPTKKLLKTEQFVWLKIHLNKKKKVYKSLGVVLVFLESP
jgi:hypothetical protein